MAALVKSWLNEELELSKDITNLEKEFANGYFFGEVMSLHGHQSNFGEFQASKLTDNIVANFELLEPSLSKIGVTLTPKLANEIITEQRGAACKLLDQMRKKLKAYGKVPPPPKDPSTKTVRPKPKRAGALDDDSDFLVRTVKKVGFDNFNKLDMAVHLRPFDEEQAAQEQKVAEDLDTLDATLASAKTERRRQQLARARSKKDFVNDWQDEGQRQWKANQRDKARREATQLKYELSVVEAAVVRTQLSRDKHRRDYLRGVEDYERGLKRLGLGGDTQLDAAALKLKCPTDSGLDHLKKLEAVVEKERFEPRSNRQDMVRLKTKRVEQVSSSSRRLIELSLAMCGCA
jgi:hypothetical protein